MAAEAAAEVQDWAQPAVTNKLREPEPAQAKSRASNDPARATHVVTLTLSGLGKARRSPVTSARVRACSIRMPCSESVHNIVAK